MARRNRSVLMSGKIAKQQLNGGYKAILMQHQDRHKLQARYAPILAKQKPTKETTKAIYHE